jgi:iron complex transport system ATP-binding protein
MSSPLLEVRAAGFAYRQEPVLNDISLAIGEGEFIGVIGPNGSGKSTLLKVLGGYLPVQRGSALFKAEPIRRCPKKILARSIAWVPQEHSMAFPFHVLEIVMMGRHPYLSPLRFETEEDHRTAEKALALTGTSALAGRRFDAISGGEKQRVLMAGAIAQETAILLLDEPTAALDLKYQMEILSILKHLNEEEHKTIVVALHDLHLASRFCRRLILLDRGAIAKDGPPAEVLTPEVLEPVYGVRVRLQDDGEGGVHITPEAPCTL